ncbi:hypothetical protein Q5O14_08915 [Eubacteriaceae bacterium ES2]|nr:hypothetical protein Q5O14_08915 [Eubacteriaceae bacterium ES2]
MNESILMLIIYGITAIIMIAIGITQLRSKKPVGFYSGEQAPSEDEIRDVQSWNKKHGMMWLIYGIIIIVSWFIGSLIGDSIFSLIPFCGGLVIPVIFMIWYHQKLVQLYRK